MRIALYQMHIAWEDKKTNIARLEEQLQVLAQKKVDVLLLPEMSFTGFSMNTARTAEAGPGNRPEKQTEVGTWEKIQFLAMKYHIALGYGWAKECGEKCENHYTIVDKSGACLSDYAKLHPFSYSGEDRWFQGGKKLTAFTLEGVPCSTFICYDLRFPEIFQTASKEAHAVLLPANWPAARSSHWKKLLQARAIENQIYIFAVNCVGRIGNLDYSGDSCVVNPDGEIVEMLSGEEGIIIYEWEDDVPRYRSSFPVKQDRKEDLYRYL